MIRSEFGEYRQRLDECIGLLPSIQNHFQTDRRTLAEGCSNRWNSAAADNIFVPGDVVIRAYLSDAGSSPSLDERLIRPSVNAAIRIYPFGRQDLGE